MRRDSAGVVDLYMYPMNTEFLSWISFEVKSRSGGGRELVTKESSVSMQDNRKFYKCPFLGDTSGDGTGPEANVNNGTGQRGSLCCYAAAGTTRAKRCYLR